MARVLIESVVMIAYARPVSLDHDAKAILTNAYRAHALAMERLIASNWSTTITVTVSPVIWDIIAK